MFVKLNNNSIINCSKVQKCFKNKRNFAQNNVYKFIETYYPHGRERVKPLAYYEYGAFALLTS